jgi:amidase
MRTLRPHDAFELGRLDACAQAELVREKEVSPLELVEAAILRAETLAPALNALSWKAYEQAREAAIETLPGAPFRGVPYLLKDSLEYTGFPCRAGSRSHGNAPASRIYPFAESLKRAGLVPVGMSTMPEFGLLISGEALRYGVTRNPWDRHVSCGGSSSGAGAAVAAGIVPVAHASDAAGSIRIPSACCGVVGLKASRGFNLRARAQHFADDMLCSDGLLARSVRDVAWGFATTSAGRAAPVTAPLKQRLRIAVTGANLWGHEAVGEVGNALRRTADLCEEMGHVVSNAPLPVDGRAVIETVRTLWAYEGGDIVDGTAARFPGRDLGELLEPWTLGLHQARELLSPAALEAANAQFAEARRAMHEFFQDYDVLLTPVLREPPAKVGRFAPTRPFDELWNSVFDYVGFTSLQNVSGGPAISLPLRTSKDGIPLGMMFAADYGKDDTLLALALELEEAKPWAGRWPCCLLETETAAQ